MLCLQVSEVRVGFNTIYSDSIVGSFSEHLADEIAGIWIHVRSLRDVRVAMEGSHTQHIVIVTIERELWIHLAFVSKRR